MAYPERQVIAMSGDGGLAMLLGDLLTTVQEKLPIKIVVFDNGTLGFVELEQRAEGMLDTYTKLENPDFGAVARSMGLAGARVTDPRELEAGVRAWLAEPGPALLDVVMDRSEFVVPPRLEASQVLGMALYSARAVLAGRGHDVVEMIEDNLHAS
jgi:pyruvate dehydrogenase (quinone)